jgi:hypothetical protein
MPNSTTSAAPALPGAGSASSVILTSLGLGGAILLGLLAYGGWKLWRSKNSEGQLTRSAPAFMKKKVPENDLRQHRRELANLKQAVHQAELLDSEKFQNSEFSMFSKLKTYMAHNISEYADLADVVELLDVAIDAQKSFATIYQIESQYYSKSQQEFYKFVTELLAREDLSRQKFQKLVLQQAEIVCELVKSEEGKGAIAKYAEEVAKVADHEFGVNLLRLFKKNHMTDYSVIGGIKDSIDRLQGANLVDLDGLMLLVLEKSNAFEKMGAMLDLKDEANSPETHRKVLQFIGLKQRYQSSYAKFQQLLVTVKDFHRYYQAITTIREKYPSHVYRVPAEFAVELPGAKLYKKYMAISDSYQEKPVDRLSELAAKAAAADDESKKLFKNSWDRSKVAQLSPVRS